MQVHLEHPEILAMMVTQESLVPREPLEPLVTRVQRETLETPVLLANLVHVVDQA